jgi:hypothetical protein
MFTRSNYNNESNLYEGLIQRRTSVTPRNESLNGTNSSTNAAATTPTFPTVASSSSSSAIPVVNEHLTSTRVSVTATREISDHPPSSYQFIVNDAIAVVDHNEEVANRKEYHSVCDPDEIPDVARAVSWYDPFYENDPNVIAAFDIDQSKVKEYMEMSKLYYIWVIIIGLAFCAFFGWLAAVLFGVHFLLSINNTRLLHSHYRNMHIAISRDGIYVDECDDKNQTLMLRTIIKFENIHDISIASYSFKNNSRYYEVSIKNVEGKVTHVLYGFFAVQKFVDIVNAMIESHRLSLDDTTTIDYNSHDENNNHPTSASNANNNVPLQQPEAQIVSFDEQY